MLLASVLAGRGAALSSGRDANAGGASAGLTRSAGHLHRRSVEYDRENSLVIAEGHVEAWQDDHVLRADKVTFDRNTGVAAAKGNVVLLEPDGQVMFADYAELTQDMKNGVLRDMRAMLAAERQAGGQRRAAHRGRDQRAVEGGLFHLQSLREGSDQAAAVGDPRAVGGAGPGAQANRIPGRRDGDVRHPGRLHAVFLAR